jgi:hypothetical protein
MRQRRRNAPRTSGSRVPHHPIISKTSHRDTLDRVAHLIELLEELDLSEGLTPGARAGLYWTHQMLADAVKYVSDKLKTTELREGRIR